LGALANQQNGGDEVTVHANLTDDTRSKTCLNNVANLGALVWCYTFTNDAVAGPVLLTSSLVNYNSYSGSGDVYTSSASLHTYMHNFLVSANKDAYVVSAFVSGLLSSWGATQEAVASAAASTSTSTGMAGLKDSFESLYGDSATSPDVTDNTASVSTWLFNYVVGRDADWSSSTRDAGTAPFLSV